MNSRNFLKARDKLETIRDQGEYLKQKWELNDRVPLLRLRHRVEMLGKKYKLPENFYDNQSIGLSVYLMRNKIVPPTNNWLIQHGPSYDEKGTTKWFAIKTYAPLSQRERKEATKWLVSLQKHYFPKEITITGRIKNQFDRDLSAFKELTRRKGYKSVKRKRSYEDLLAMVKSEYRPIKMKTYKEDGYLARVEKSYHLSYKELRRLEEQHEDDIVIDINKIMTGKMPGTPNTIRQAVKRLSKLIKNFFGVDIIVKH